MYIGTYLRPPTLLVQIYLIFEHHLYKIYLDSSLSRYLSDVSPVKLSKDKKRKYFKFAIQNSNCMYWGTSLSPEKHVLFNGIYKGHNNTGIEIKQFRSSENNEHINVDDFSSVKKNRSKVQKERFSEKTIYISTGHQ